jgi:hypothetical protein
MAILTAVRTQISLSHHISLRPILVLLSYLHRKSQVINLHSLHVFGPSFLVSLMRAKYLVHLIPHYIIGLTVCYNHSPPPHLVPRQRMSRSYTSSPPRISTVCSGTALAFQIFCYNVKMCTGGKARQGCDADHSPSLSAEVVNE